MHIFRRIFLSPPPASGGILLYFGEEGIIKKNK
jgi:hypothetical protein